MILSVNKLRFLRSFQKLEVAKTICKVVLKKKEECKHMNFFSSFAGSSFPLKNIQRSLKWKHFSYIVISDSVYS